MPREIKSLYVDPLELIWLETATRCGMRVTRDPEVFASWTGDGTLRLGTPETLDADDSLAQMIFHEICHHIVQGPASFHLPDWGLDNDNPDDVAQEHACLRLQAELAGQYQLRRFMAATTDFRDYYDRLPEKPLAAGSDPAIPIAKEAYSRWQSAPTSRDVHSALNATREITAIVGRIGVSHPHWLVDQETLPAIASPQKEFPRRA